MKIKKNISHLLRKYRLLYFTDYVRFFLQKVKFFKSNIEFKRENPSILLPPDYLLYESFQMNYRKYYIESYDTAHWLVNHLQHHLITPPTTILDWGCGPARILRHLPAFFGDNCNYFGTDYNPKTIAWCKANLPDIQFNLNTLEATLPYEDDFFDIIYGVSIYTHLSKKMHYTWHKELSRILKPQGIMLITTQGDPFKEKLTDNELKEYETGNLIVRGKVKEGHRTFSAFHPTPFMEKLFANMHILQHIVTTPEKGKWLPQDVWIIRK